MLEVEKTKHYKRRVNMSYDYSKLRGKIKEKFSTQNEFAKKIGMGRVSLSQRLNCKLEFSQEDINKSIEVLDLTASDIPEYFFNSKV
jgi:hypothetical protein